MFYILEKVGVPEEEEKTTIKEASTLLILSHITPQAWESWVIDLHNYKVYKSIMKDMQMEDSYIIF